MGEFTVEGKLKAIRTYVPDMEIDIIKKLTDKGFSREEIINKLTGLK
jgi:hypothetical protein